MVLVGSWPLLQHWIVSAKMLHSFWVCCLHIQRQNLSLYKTYMFRRTARETFYYLARWNGRTRFDKTTFARCHCSKGWWTIQNNETSWTYVFYPVFHIELIQISRKRMGLCLGLRESWQCWWWKISQDEWWYYANSISRSCWGYLV